MKTWIFRATRPIVCPDGSWRVPEGTLFHVSICSEMPIILAPAEAPDLREFYASVRDGTLELVTGAPVSELAQAVGCEVLTSSETEGDRGHRRKPLLSLLRWPRRKGGRPGTGGS